MKSGTTWDKNWNLIGKAASEWAEIAGFKKFSTATRQFYSFCHEGAPSRLLNAQNYLNSTWVYQTIYAFAIASNRQAFNFRDWVPMFIRKYWPGLVSFSILCFWSPIMCYLELFYFTNFAISWLIIFIFSKKLEFILVQEIAYLIWKA